MTSAVCKLCSVQVLHNVNSFPCLPLQVIEDNTGVRRVVVTPQSPECYPPSYPSAISPTHHLPPYLAHHPHFIHNSHTAFYPPVTGPGDMPPQFFPQHHLPPTIYGEQGELGGGTGVSHLFSGGSKGQCNQEWQMDQRIQGEVFPAGILLQVSGCVTIPSPARQDNPMLQLQVADTKTILT